MNSKGKDLVHQELITRILEALRGPKQVAVVHLRGHQKGLNFGNRGSNLADELAKEAALRDRESESNDSPCEELKKQWKVYSFTTQEKEKLDQMGIKQGPEGQWKLPDGRIVLPKSIALEILQKFHDQTHWATQALIDQFAAKYMSIGIHNLAKQV